MMLRFLIVALLLLFTTAPSPEPSIHFEDVTKASSIQDFLVGMMGHAGAWGDFNKDGLQDLFVAGFCDRPESEYLPAKAPVPAKLFSQLPNGKFRILDLKPGFCARSSAALFVDLDGDQYPELFVSNNARESSSPVQNTKSKLFSNQKGAFQEVSFDSSVLSARNVTAFDYNGDGVLDLFLVEDPFKKGPQTRGSVLLKNLGHLKFQNVNETAGIPNDVFGLGVAVSDLNNDGRADFFVTYSNRLFLSGPNNRYREVLELKKVFEWQPLDNEDWPSGAAFGDLNLDGNLDLVITNHHEPAHNKIFLNRGLHNGVPSFVDITKEAGFSEAVPVKCPHVEIQDFDNDGYPDIYTSAAWMKNVTVPLIYRNQGFGAESIPKFQPPEDFKKPMGYFPTGPTADFDRDGKLDIFLVSWFPNIQSRLLRNVTAAANWLEVRGPIGSKMRLYSNGRLIGNQQMFIGVGFGCGQPSILHFGLGKLQNADLETILPNGSTIKKNVQANRIIDVQN